MAFFENIQAPETSVLVGLDTGDYDAEVSIDELEELAKTAGSKVLAKIIQKKEKPDPATYIGSGRLKEIRDFCRDNEADLIIFDCELHHPSKEMWKSSPMFVSLTAQHLYLTSLPQGRGQKREEYRLSWLSLNIPSPVSAEKAPSFQGSAAV